MTLASRDLKVGRDEERGQPKESTRMSAIHTPRVWMVMRPLVLIAVAMLLILVLLPLALAAV